MSLRLYIDLDDRELTLGDFTSAKGALMDAAAQFIDWEKLNAGAADAVGSPARILLQLAHGLPSEALS